MPVFVLVDHEACVNVVVALEQLLHAILDSVNAMAVVLNDHNDFRYNAAGESGISNKHYRRSIDDDEIVLLF